MLVQGLLCHTYLIRAYASMVATLGPSSSRRNIRSLRGCSLLFLDLRGVAVIVACVNLHSRCLK